MLRSRNVGLLPHYSLFLSILTSFQLGDLSVGPELVNSSRPISIRTKTKTTNRRSPLFVCILIYLLNPLRGRHDWSMEFIIEAECSGENVTISFRHLTFGNKHLFLKVNWSIFWWLFPLGHYWVCWTVCGRRELQTVLVSGVQVSVAPVPAEASGIAVSSRNYFLLKTETKYNQSCVQDVTLRG